MANPLAIRISNVRIDQGSLAYDWELDPPADVTASTKIALYTATDELAWETRTTIR